MTDSVIRWIVAVFFVFFIADRSFSIIMSLREPFTWTGRGAWADPDTIKVGDPLRAHYQFYRYFYCNTDLNRFVQNIETTDIIWRDRVPGGATALGPALAVNTVTFNPPLKPGQYILRSILY